MPARPYPQRGVLPPWGTVRDIARRLPRLICPDYYPLLIVQAGSEEVGEKSLKAIKDDFGGTGAGS